MKGLVVVFTFFIIGFAVVFAAGTPTATRGEERLLSYEKHVLMKETSIFKRLRWKEIGPYFMGGRIVDIEGYENSPYKFYIAAASGGLWLTENNGTTWTPVFDSESSITIGDIAVSQTDETLIWVGTGEHNSARSTYSGTGVFKSTDEGKTWENMGLIDSFQIGRVIIDPGDNNIVYVAVLGHLYTYNEERGLYKTTDGGRTWKRVLYISPKTGVIDVVMHPKNRDILYAAAWQRERKAWNFREGGEESGMYKSVDGGETWKKIGKGFPANEYIGRIGLAVCPSNPGMVYALLDNQESRDKKKENKNTDPISRVLNANIKGPEVYRSGDAGETWEKTHTSYLDRVVFTYGYYFGQIRVAPDNRDIIYILGVPLMKSTDGGKTFKDISLQGGMYGIGGVHADMHALWIDPKNSRRLILGNDGGLNISYDEGAAWQKIGNLPLAQCYTVHYDFQKPYRIYTGLQDNGINVGPSDFKKHGREILWQMLLGGDGAFIQPEPGNPHIVYAAIQYGNIFRLNLQEKSKTKFIKPGLRDKNVSYRFNWLSPFFISPHNPYILYMGANKVFKSVNSGDQWMEISPDLTGQNNIDGDVPYATIVSLDESPLSPGLLYAGTDDGNVWINKDIQSPWEKINGGLPKKWVTRLVASRYKKERVYITLTGYREDDFKTYVFVSEDYGSNWNSIKGNLPEEPLNVIREDPEKENILYLGTDLGIYVTLDRGKTWHSLKNNLPTNAVYDLRVHPREKELIIGTHGRGVFLLPVESIRQLIDEVSGKVLHLFDITDVETVSRPGHVQVPLRFEYYSGEGGKLRCLIKDKAGQDVHVFDIEAVKGFNVVEWDLVVEGARKKKIEKGEYTVILKKGEAKVEEEFDVN